MKIRLLKMMTLIMLLLTALPLSALAASANITLTNIAAKVQGESFRVTGSTSFDEVVVKVVRPSNTLFYYDVLIPQSGVYSSDISLPSNAELGVYTVVAGKGTDVATVQFEVKGATDGPVPGGGGVVGGGTVPVTPSANTITISVSAGGTVSLNGATLNFPAAAMGSDIKVTVEKVADPSKLPLDSTQSLISDVYEITKDKDGLFQKDITITLPFDASKVDLAKYNLSIYWLNEQTGKWVSLDNPQIDVNKGTLSGTVNHFTKFAVLATEKEEPAGPEIALTDIKGHWAEAKIVQLIQLGAISGYPDQTFKPNNNITRAEFVSVLVKALGIQAGSGKTYADTANHWAKDAISAAAEQGIVTGYTDTTFGPNDPITREQMAAMIVKAAQLPLATDGKAFTDSSDISAWATSFVATAASNGILSGYVDGSLKPKGHASRAEAATVILKALSLQA